MEYAGKRNRVRTMGVEQRSASIMLLAQPWVTGAQPRPKTKTARQAMDVKMETCSLARPEQ